MSIKQIGRYQVTGPAARIRYPDLLDGQVIGHHDATVWHHLDATTSTEAFVVRRDDGHVHLVEANWFAVRGLPVPHKLPEPAAIEKQTSSYRAVRDLYNIALSLHNKAEGLMLAASNTATGMNFPERQYVELRRSAEMLAALFAGDTFPAVPQATLTTGEPQVVDLYAKLGLDPSLAGQSTAAAGVWICEHARGFQLFCRENPVPAALERDDFRILGTQVMFFVDDLLRQVPRVPETTDSVTMEGGAEAAIVMIPDRQPHLATYGETLALVEDGREVLVSADEDGEWRAVPAPMKMAEIYRKYEEAQIARNEAKAEMDKLTPAAAQMMQERFDAIFKAARWYEAAVTPFADAIAAELGGRAEVGGPYGIAARCCISIYPSDIAAIPVHERSREQDDAYLAYLEVEGMHDTPWRLAVVNLTRKEHQYPRNSIGAINGLEYGSVILHPDLDIRQVLDVVRACGWQASYAPANTGAPVRALQDEPRPANAPEDDKPRGLAP